MQPFPFSFDFDASGSPDPITLPQDFPGGVCTVRLKPPIGHAWTFVGQGSTTYALQTDEIMELGPLYCSAGMTIGKAVLDTGSGTGKGIAS